MRGAGLQLQEDVYAGKAMMPWEIGQVLPTDAVCACKDGRSPLPGLSSPSYSDLAKAAVVMESWPKEKVMSNSI